MASKVWGQKAEAMENEREAAPPAIAAALEHLTGPARGAVTELSASALDVSLGPGRVVYVSESIPGTPRDDLVARLHRAENTYEIEAPEDLPIWVNGNRVAARRLENGAIIEFGVTGPLSRFRLYGQGGPVRKTVTDIVGDCADYLRVSRQPVANRMLRAFRGLLRQLARETTTLFRVTVLISIVSLAALAYQQHQLNARLQQNIDISTVRLDSIAAALTRTRNEALRQSDLTVLRQELGQRLSTNAERVEALEQRSLASGRVIAASLPSVAFLQGAYGFRERSTGRMLRHVVNDDGRPLISPRGQPLLSLDGDGPVAELQFTGTGFVVAERGVLVTNRHVALPWETETRGKTTDQNLEPVMIKFIAYLSGKAEAVPVELLLASESADLAVLLREDERGAIPSLRLADARPVTGTEVLVMGYPTGLRSMLAQSGEAFIEELQKTENTGFWSVAARLAEAGYIAPLSSRGIVSQATTATIVYDAETTHGGSGGPVLDMNGDVVAVNTAILPEFGGSNLGVPAEKVRALLEEAGLR
jgi:S1-C subfamily serine protease